MPLFRIQYLDTSGTNTRYQIYRHHRLPLWINVGKKKSRPPSGPSIDSLQPHPSISFHPKPAVMVKRKREETAKEPKAASKPSKVVKSVATEEKSSVATDASTITLQVITGSYERVLHGFTAAIPVSALTSNDKKGASASASKVHFVDTFLFEAHSSSIRCLALSPIPKADVPEEQRTVLMASGGTDERVNIYTLSASPIAVSDNFAPIPSLGGKKILENPKNRELGALLHHESSITALCVPSRSKILAASEDNTISVNRVRDFSVISSIKAPRPKTQGRPSGDTAPVGGAPSGVNDFAVHPSMKLMLSVGKGEKSMRLWNLVTGKKAGVLNFGREILQSVKEGKYSTGEGRKIVWNIKGDEFAVAFEWGVVAFGIVSLSTVFLATKYRANSPPGFHANLPGVP